MMLQERENTILVTVLNNLLRTLDNSSLTTPISSPTFPIVFSTYIFMAILHSPTNHFPPPNTTRNTTAILVRMSARFCITTSTTIVGPC